MYRILFKAIAALLLCLIFVLNSFDVQAQEVIASGKIVEQSTEEPLPGVNISIRGTTIGTVSDVDGNFELKTDTPPPFILVFSFMGYGKQEIFSDSRILILKM